MSWGMRATPARRARDAAKRDELQAKIEEDKLVEFRMACEDGDADGCFSLAEWHAIVAKDHDTAADLFRTNCLTRGHGASCHHMGRLHVNGRGVDRSKARALEYMQRACDLEHPDGCGVAGMLLMREARRSARAASAASSGSGVAERKPRAASGSGASDGGGGGAAGGSAASQGATALGLVRKGCDLGCAAACAFLGGVMLGGIPELGIPHTPAEAVKPLTFACDNNEGAACHNLAILFKRGAPGVAVDPAKSSKFLSQAKELFKSHGAHAGQRA